MKPSKYIQSAKRTEPERYLFKKTGDVTPRIEHAVFGIVTEAGELIDCLKKAKIYNQKLDKVNLVEEAGDLMWYLAILSDELDVSFEEIWDKNIRKLKVRFPEKYNHNRAKDRDLKYERNELEK
jgi:NTP pyrophosphatase (non-canonical NTP hydrolase)